MIVLIITIYTVALMLCVCMHHTIDMDRPIATNRLMIVSMILIIIDIILILITI